MENFTERLTFLLSDVLELSGNALAKEMEISQGLISRYRKGETKPPYDFVARLCEKYGISANWLLLNVLPIKLNELDPKDCDESVLKQIEHKKLMASDYQGVINSVNEFKERHSL